MRSDMEPGRYFYTERCLYALLCVVAVSAGCKDTEPGCDPDLMGEANTETDTATDWETTDGADEDSETETFEDFVTPVAAPALTSSSMYLLYDATYPSERPHLQKLTPGRYNL